MDPKVAAKRGKEKGRRKGKVSLSFSPEDEVGRMSSLSEEQDRHVLFGRGRGHLGGAGVGGYRRKRSRGKAGGRSCGSKEGGLKGGRDRVRRLWRRMMSLLNEL